MPNHVTNVLTFDCTEKRFNEILESVKGPDEEAVFDFNTLIPMPKDLSVGASSKASRAYENYISKSKEEYAEIYKDDPISFELGKTYANNVEHYGYTNWYDWCNRYWNTKWNAYDCSVGNNFIEFYTAWSNVPDIVRVLSMKFPDVEIVYGWADEACGSNVGRVTVKNGEIILEEIYDDYTKAAYELAAEINGYDLEEIGYTLSEDGTTYEYSEDF